MKIKYVEIEITPDEAKYITGIFAGLTIASIIGLFIKPEIIFLTPVTFLCTFVFWLFSVSD